MARADQGTLTRTELWWSPAPGYEGRYWTSEAGGGAAWGRLGPLQAGPLTGSAGGEGLRSWSRGTDLSSGHWGLDFEVDKGGFWAVQTPGSFEVGAQAQGRGGSWSLAAGADRRWDLSPTPGGSAWEDRVRMGLGWASDGVGTGLEAAVKKPEGGPPGFSGRGRVSWDAGERGWAARGTASSGPDGLPWTLSLRGFQGPWSAKWRGVGTDPLGLAVLGWDRGGWEVSAGWGPRAGVELDLALSKQVQKIDLSGEVGGKVDDQGGTGRLSVGASGTADRGRWSGRWSLGPGDLAPLQTVTAAWREPTFEAEVRWKAEGLRLGWFGPETVLTTTVRVFF